MRIPATTLIGTSLLIAACAAPPPPALKTTRLVDLYEPDPAVAPASLPALARTEWRFDAPAPAHGGAHAATLGWEAGPMIRGLAVRDGRLTAETTGDFPLLHVERVEMPASGDVLHAIEIRASVSAGANLSVEFRGGDKIDLKQVVEYGRAFTWLTATPLVADGKPHSYTVRPRRSVAAAATRHVLIRPTDAAGARVAIESVRLVFRKEHLAAIPSGVSWQSLSEIYRETLVSRSPETTHFPLTVPKHPMLDLGIGTIEDGPVTFRVAVTPAGTGAPEKVILQRTVTTPHRWEPATAGLDEFAGQRVTLALSVTAEKPSSLGFWGSPVVRSRQTEAPAADAPPRGVILVWCDTLRRDHMQVYGYQRPTTPNLTRLASEGTLFTNSISQATWTKVSTPSLFTSLYPSSHTVKEFADRLPASAATIAEIYRDAGYATLSMSSILFTGTFTNMHQGFEELHEDRSLSDQESSKTSREYVDRLLPWLEAHRDVPFFVFLHVSDPHDPYKPYAPYDTMWAEAAGTAEHERQAKEVKKHIADPLMKMFGMPTRQELTMAGFDPEAYVAHDIDWYDGSIRAMDAEMGRLVERLAGLGLDKSTTLVFTGDHGEEFLEHGRMFHGQTVYGELVNMPLIMWGPGSVPAGRVVDETVRTIDIMPTLLEISALPPPSGIQGRSLRALMSGPAGSSGGTAASPGGLLAADAGGTPVPDAVSEKAETTPVGGGAPPPHGTESYALVSDGWKLIHNVKRMGEMPEFELYDVAADPLNRHNVAGAHDEIVARLVGRLTAWRSLVESGRLAADSASSQSMSAEELERLRSLGYIQ